MKKPSILVTNDDGIHGPGLRPLIAAMRRVGKVIAVVPDQERSADSHSLTLHKPIRVYHMAPGLTAVSGSPADCARFGVVWMLKGKVDLLVSGINRGYNLGEDIIYSGTVAAAREARILGVPAIAFSQDQDVDSFALAADFACAMARQTLRRGLPAGVILNVNVPPPRGRSFRGTRAARLGRRYAVMQNRRYLKGIRACRGLVASKLGRVGIINADFYIGAHFGGFRDLMDNVLVLDMAVHTFDMARFISGSDAVSVWCKEFNPAWSWYKGASSAICAFEMANGSVFCYRGSWCAEGANTGWEADWRIVGEKGTAVWNGKEAPWAELALPREKGQLIGPASRVEASLDWAGREGHAGCLDEMFLSLVEGRPAETECSDNLKTVEMVFGAIESSRTGKTVALG